LRGQHQPDLDWRRREPRAGRVAAANRRHTQARSHVHFDDGKHQLRGRRQSRRRCAKSDRQYAVSRLARRRGRAHDRFLGDLSPQRPELCRDGRRRHLQIWSVYYPDFDLPETHIGDLIEAKGKTWRGFVQKMKSPCNLVSQGWFAPDDEPFAQFHDVISNPTRCQASLLDLTAFTAAIGADTLPNFAWLAANGWWDGEGAWEENFDVKFSLVKQDAFLRLALEPLVASSAWSHSHSIVIVTWDETDGWGWPDNHVPTIVIGSPGLVRAGATVAHHYDGYGVLRTAELALGLESLDRFDAYAEPLNAVFAKDVGNRKEGELRVNRAADTRGSLRDTFGQVGVSAAVEQGQPLVLTVSGPFDATDVVNFEPLGVAPSNASFPFGFDASGSVS